MKPPPFEYRAARTVDEAVGLLHALGDEAKVIAGGQSLIPMMNFRLAQPRILIDVNGLNELDFVRIEADELVVGARTRTYRVETSPEVREAAPLLAEAAALVGHPAIRHRGTIGGSLVHGDSAAELPTAAVALDALIVLRSARGTREIQAADFFLGPFMTAAEPDELLTEVHFPRWPLGSGWAFLEFSRRRGDFAVVGAAAMVHTEGRRIKRAAVALCGVGGAPSRAFDTEQALVGAKASHQLAASSAQQAANGLEPSADIHGSAEYRTDLVREYVKRALVLAFARAGVES